MSKLRKRADIGSDCVACGCCMKICPAEAISIPYGVIAIVDQSKCIGCGKCAKACPAGVIEIINKEAAV